MQTRNKASILFISLWTVCLLTTFSIVLGYQVRQKLTLAQALDEKSKLHFIADAGIKKAIAELKKEEQKLYDVLNDTWSNNISVFKEIDIGDGKVSIAYDYLNEQSGINQIQYGLIDEERKININRADLTVLERFFRIVLNLDQITAQELAASVIDWRDGDSQLSIPLGSAEDIDYRNMQYPYEARDLDFEVLDEILLVKGMSQDAFEKIKEYVTIYGDGKVNINTVSKPVLLALGLDDDIAGKILFYRAGEDGIMGNADDNIFDTASNIIPKLSQLSHLSDFQLAKLSVIVDQHFVVKSNNFMIKAVAKLNNKKSFAALICVVNRSGKVLYWQES